MNHLTKTTDLSALLYDLIFRLFWFSREREAEFRQRVIKLMNLTGGESVLDVGCGTGTLTSMIAKKTNGKGNVLGVDLAPRMIEIARKKARNQQSPIEYRIGSSLTLPLDNETFEVVVTSLVYHQLFSWEEKLKTLGEIWRVLKPEGRYVAAEFTRFTPGNLVATHDSLIRKIPLFGTNLVERNGFHIAKKVEIAKGITIILVGKVG